jgi:hypothetical protein
VGLNFENGGTLELVWVGVGRSEESKGNGDFVVRDLVGGHR